MEKLMEILEDLRPDVDFENEDALITNGILDSFDVISLVGEIEDEFDVTVRPNHLVPANFDSAKAIMALIEQLKG